MSDMILEAKQLEYRFPDGTMGLQGLSLGIRRGQKAAFLGSNGAGKTTLFQHFNGLLRPTAGKVRFNGQDIRYRRRDLLHLRQRVGLVLQDPDSQLFAATVWQEITFGPLNLGLPAAEVRQRVETAMEATEIAALRDRPAHLLSAGQKKRVTLAAVLAMQPEVIICDEPTASLDPRHSRELLQLFNQLQHRGYTVVLSTHDVNLAYSWADEVYLMAQGTLLDQGQPEQVFSQRQQLLQADLEQPVLLAIYQGLQSRGTLTGVPPRTVEGLMAVLQLASV